MNKTEYTEMTGSTISENLQSLRKSSDTHEKAAEQWVCRLRSLPAEQQAKISGKYYGGAMPWKEGR